MPGEIGVDNVMNDSIKQLISGAIIALTGVVAGGAMVIWTQAMVKNETVNGQFSVNSGQLTASSSQPVVFNGQGVQQNPAFRSILPSTNVPQVRFPTQSIMPTGSINPANGRTQPMIPPAFQKVQDVPQVRAAREALSEAQKRFAETVRRAAENTPGTPAVTAKSAPLVIQIPPSVSATNTTAKAKP